MRFLLFVLSALFRLASLSTTPKKASPSKHTTDPVRALKWGGSEHFAVSSWFPFQRPPNKGRIQKKTTGPGPLSRFFFFFLEALQQGPAVGAALEQRMRLQRPAAVPQPPGPSLQADTGSADLAVAQKTGEFQRGLPDRQVETKAVLRFAPPASF